MDDDVSRRVALEVADGIATVRLDRPDKLNALDPAMFEALVETGTSLIDRDDIGAVVLTGAGRAFCAGLDFGSFTAMAGDGAGRVVVPREPLGAARALGQQLRAAHVGDQPPLDLHDRQLRVGGDEPDVGTERDLQPPAEGEPVHGGDHRRGDQ
jgi:hypothetical protein